MKKLFYVLAIVALAACNNEGEKTDEVKADTTAPAPAQDTTASAPADTTAKPAADTSAAK